MTLERAVELLNERRWRGERTWQAEEDGDGGRYIVAYDRDNRLLDFALTDEDAIAIASWLLLRDALAAEATAERRESAHKALSDACHIVWHHKSLEHTGCEREPHFWSIPADKNRDVDLRIGDMLIVLDKLAALVEGE